MPEIPPVVVKVEPDPSKLAQLARLAEKHFGALADDLEKLRNGDDSGPEPDREIREDRPWKM